MSIFQGHSSSKWKNTPQMLPVPANALLPPASQVLHSTIYLQNQRTQTLDLCSDFIIVSGIKDVRKKGVCSNNHKGAL